MKLKHKKFYLLLLSSVISFVTSTILLIGLGIILYDLLTK
jgi:hypothetical protein